MVLSHSYHLDLSKLTQGGRRNKEKCAYQGEEVLGASHSIVVASSTQHTIGGPHLFPSPRSPKFKRYLEEFGWMLGEMSWKKEVGCHSSHKNNKELRNCAIKMKKFLELLTH